MPGMQCDQLGKAGTSSFRPPPSQDGDCLKTTPEGSKQLDRRGEALNEELANEVERNVTRGEEIGSAARELAAPRELKRHADPSRFESGKETCSESSDSSYEQQQLADKCQPFSCRDANTASVDADTSPEWTSMVKGDANPEVRKHTQSQTKNNDDYVNGGVTNGGRKLKREMNSEVPPYRTGDDIRSSTVPNTRRRFATQMSKEENRRDERTVEMTTQESSREIREKVMEIASLDELGSQRKKEMSSPPTTSQSCGKTRI